jgi:hypothetical protein
MHVTPRRPAAAALTAIPSYASRRPAAALHGRTAVGEHASPGCACALYCTSTLLIGYRHTSSSSAPCMLPREPSLRFACKLCDYRSETRRLLRAHAVLHVEEKSYNCTAADCKYAARTASAMWKHVKRNHRE